MRDLSKTKNIGIDVAKDELVIYLDGDQSLQTVANEHSAIAVLAESWKTFDRLERIVIEASGGYEALAVGMFADCGLPVCLVNPKRVRDFAKSSGTLAKTDRLDARLLADFARAVSPMLYQLPDKVQSQLSELIRRRQQLVEIKAAEQTRLKRSSEAVKPSLERHLAWLAAELADLDVDHVITYTPKRPIAESPDGETRKVRVSSHRAGVQIKSRQKITVETKEVK